MPQKPAPRKLTQKQPVLTALFIILFLVAAGFSSLSYLRNYKSFSTTSPSPVPKSKTYHSDVMDFTVEVPSGFEIEEKFTIIKLTNNKGEILIAQNGTNYNTLKDYLNDPRLKEVNELSNLVFSNENETERAEGFLGEQKVYFIYSNYRVYSLSTLNRDLYTALDQIAQSFRYTLD